MNELMIRLEVAERMEKVSKEKGNINAIEEVTRAVLTALKETVVGTGVTPEVEAKMFDKTTTMLENATELFCMSKGLNKEEVVSKMLENALGEMFGGVKDDLKDELLDSLQELAKILGIDDMEIKISYLSDEEEIEDEEEEEDPDFALRDAMIEDLQSGTDVRDVAIRCLVSTGLISIEEIMK